jgi:hypothetical protein
MVSHKTLALVGLLRAAAIAVAFPAPAPAPAPTPPPAYPPLREGDITSDIGSYVGSEISGLGSDVSSYIVSGVPQFFQDFPTGTQVLSSLGISSSDLAATPTQVLNLP